MQKSRPLGATILAYWALAGSGVMIVLHVFFLAGFSLGVPLSVITAPLGSGLISFLVTPLSAAFSILLLVLAVFFAIVGLHTFKGRRWAWFANVGMSMAALVQFGVALSNLTLFTSAGTSMLIPAWVIAASLLRLYYLFRPHVRDYFNTWSIFAKTQTA